MSKPKEYKIKTIQDVLDCVNEDNIDTFITDFRDFIKYCNTMDSLNKMLGGNKPLNSEFTWIDDGKNDKKITIKIK